MIRIDKSLQNYIKGLNRENIYFSDHDLGNGDSNVVDILPPGVLEKLLGYGVVIPFAEAFSFNKKGILLIGEGGIGKTPILIEFKKLHPDITKEITQDSPVIYKKENMLKPILYDYNLDSSDLPFFAPFTNQGSIDEFSLDYILHLKYRDNLQIKKGDIKEAVNHMVFEGCAYPETPENKNKVYEIFKNVKCFDVLKPMGYGSHKKGIERLAVELSENYSQEAKEELHKTVLSLKKIIES